VIVGGALWGNCNWGGGNVNVNVNRYNNFNRTNITNGNWNHSPQHRGACPIAISARRSSTAAGSRERRVARAVPRTRRGGQQSIQRGDVGGRGDLGGGAAPVAIRQRIVRCRAVAVMLAARSDSAEAAATWRGGRGAGAFDPGGRRAEPVPTAVAARRAWARRARPGTWVAVREAAEVADAVAVAVVAAAAAGGVERHGECDGDQNEPRLLTMFRACAIGSCSRSH
jgi:hypothetical protein